MVTDADYNDIQAAFSRALAAFSHLSDQDFDFRTIQNILLYSWQSSLLLSLCDHQHHREMDGGFT